MKELYSFDTASIVFTISLRRKVYTASITICNLDEKNSLIMGSVITGPLQLTNFKIASLEMTSKNWNC